MEAQLKELLPFLRDKNPQVRQLALENLVPHTPKEAPLRKIFFSGQSGVGLQKPSENNVIRDLKLLCRDQLAVAHDAFKALVNLSDAPMLVSSLSEPSFLNFLVSYTINPQSILADLASMLLSNLTASSNACAAVLAMKVSIIVNDKLPNGFYATQSRSGSCTAPVPFPGGDEKEVLALPLLLDAFVQGARIDEIQDFSKRARKASLHFLGSVFGNLTSSPTGREFFLTPRPSNPINPNSDPEYPVAKIMSFTEHKDTIRRGGVASTIKNCAFNARAHKAILSSETDRVAVSPSKVAGPGVGVLPYILLPLAGPEEFDLEDQEKLPPALQLLPPDKAREPDAALRLTFVETLLLLSHTRWGRDFLRANGVYEIIRAAHEVETVDKISEHMERLVMLIKGDEPAQGPSEEEEFELAASRNRLELESDLSSKPVAEEEEGPTIGSLVADDDEDDQIEEI
ncbi:dna-binding protein hgh1 [Moniliophthora roreri MCA 2997]|uniref:Dna-binding protein hgh1 n=2 Tax=Moniliophthora roreri TaxID=221103 RepID=V2WSI0_MONRO|nr:dna-binding protein hgh1 [Moniliophthora roreri MCA 2997]